MSIEPARRRPGASPLVFAGIVLVAMGCLVGAVSPFVDDPRVFVVMLGSAFACALGMWLIIRLSGYFTNPNLPMAATLLYEPPNLDSN